MSEDAAKQEAVEMLKARETLEAMEGLINSEGWRVYVTILRRQEDQRRMSPPKREDGFGALLAREFENGEIAGLQLAQRMPELTLQTVKEMLKDYAEQEQEGVDGQE